jgi:NADH-ubiquinone oxidoreductase chain 5
MFIAGVGANFEYDLRMIIALSALSQLGLMIRIIFVGFAGLAFFHLLTHALFKALLFICAGAIIHVMGDSQDIRFIGALSFQMPLTSVCVYLIFLYVAYLFWLVSIPRILFWRCLLRYVINVFGFLLFFVSTGLAVCYSFRLSYYVFCGNFNLYPIFSMSEMNFNIVRGILGLLSVTVFGGRVLSSLIFPTPSMICLPFYMRGLALFVRLLGGLLRYLLSQSYLGNSLMSLRFYGLSSFRGSMWFIPYVSTYGVVLSPLFVGYSSCKVFDFG